MKAFKKAIGRKSKGTPNKSKHVDDEQQSQEAKSAAPEATSEVPANAAAEEAPTTPAAAGKGGSADDNAKVLQAAWRGKTTRKQKKAKEEKATLLQSAWRGMTSRKKQKKQEEDVGFLQSTIRGGSSLLKATSHTDASHSSRIEMRAKMAAVLYPSRTPEEREVALCGLEEALQDKAPPYPTEAPSAAGGESSAAPAQSTPKTEQPSKETEAATAIQAKLRGLLARKHSAKLNAAGEARAQEPAADDAASASGWKQMLPSVFILLGGGIAAIASLYVCYLYLPWFVMLLVKLLLGLAWRTVYFVVLLVLGLYAWIRMPLWLGTIGTHLITRLPLHNFPIGFETIRVQPWISFSPLRAYADVSASNFYMGNAPNLEWRDPDLVRVEHVSLCLYVDLDFLMPLIRGQGLGGQSIVLRFKHLFISGVTFNMILSTTGELNLVAMQRKMADNELREALGGAYVFPYRTLTLPNVLKIRIHAARKLQALPNLKPRVEVTMRNVKLSTPDAQRVQGKGGTVEYIFDGAEMLIPVQYEARDGLLIVRVYNDNVGFGRRPALLGQWFMTVKYLVMFPKYCKHSKIVAPGDGSIAGTFLLTDAKLRGSAMRHLEAWDLGDGFSGELDMSLHYTHSPLLDPEPPKPPMSAINQLGEFPDEDVLKMGNKAELKTVLQSVPLRFDIENFIIRNAVIEFSDLFVGAVKGSKDIRKDEKVVRIDSISFPRFYEVTLYKLMDQLANQLVVQASTNFSALSSALSEVLSGVGSNVVNTMSLILPGAVAATVALPGAAARLVRMSK